MTENNTGDKNPNNTSADWMKMMTDFWSPVMKTWEAGMTPPSQSDKDPENPDKGSSPSLEDFSRMWQKMMKTAAEPMGMEHLEQSSTVVPDIMMVFAKTCLRGYSRFHESVNERMEKKEGGFSFDDSGAIKKEFFQNLTDAYESEFRQFFKMPQIGLGRVYQERVLEAADKYNLFQGAFSNFLHQLYLPMEESFQRLQQEVAEHAEKDALEEDPKVYYNMWVKYLEDHYMTVFKQPDFSKTLGHTLGALNEYSAAKQAVVNDVLKQNAIPTHEDLDELYKEIYLLKKRMRIYEKQ